LYFNTARALERFPFSETRLDLDDATLAALTDDRDNWQFSK
jgi:hypothetical protein